MRKDVGRDKIMKHDRSLSYALVISTLVLGLGVLLSGCGSKGEDESRSGSPSNGTGDSTSAGTHDENAPGAGTEGGESGLIMHVTDENFDAEVLQSEMPVLVDFWSETCPPCKLLAPILEEVATELQGKLKIRKLNTTENPVKTRAYRITAIPALLVFRDGELVGQTAGYMPKEKLREFIDSTLEEG